MSNSRIFGGLGVTALVAAPLFATTLFVAMPQAQALSCSVIADQLSHQNEPLQDAKERLMGCARKYVKHDNTLASKTKAQWESLCDDDKNAYSALLNNRQTILVRCHPRGSED